MSYLEYMQKLVWVPLIALIISIFSMVFDTSPPGQYTGLIDAKVQNNRVVLKYGFKRLRACDVDVYRQVIHEGRVDTLQPVHVTADQIRKMDITSKDVVDQIIPLPFGSLNEPVTLRVALDYSCNLFQQIKPLRYEYDVVFSLKR